MELSVESLIPANFAPETWADCAESLEQWNEAYRRVEAYFLALRVDNKLLLSSLVLKILGRASERHHREPERSPVELAAEETDRHLVSWFRRVLGDVQAEPDDRLSARGRLCLLLVSPHVQWQQLFLNDEPLPEPFAEAMRNAYLQADPEFSFVQMQPRPIDLGIFDTASRTIGSMGKRGVALQWLLWTLFAGFLALLFFTTR